MVGGSRWAVVPMLVEWVLEYGAVAATVEYRLAPEFVTRCPSRTATRGLNGSPAAPTRSASTHDGC